jgi:uncharacterized membrane protein YqiK
MIRYILAVIVLLSILGAGVVWLTNIIIKAERAETIERAIELTRDTDKRLGVVRKATDYELCRALGGEEEECKGQ